MSFEKLVAHLQLGRLHTLVARVLETTSCLPLLQEMLFLDTVTLHQIVKDFIRLGLCVPGPDPNFLLIDTGRILATAAKLKPVLPFTFSFTTLEPSINKSPIPMWKPKINRSRSMRPKCPLLRSGLRVRKKPDMNKQL